MLKVALPWTKIQSGQCIREYVGYTWLVAGTCIPGIGLKMLARAFMPISTGDMFNIDKLDHLNLVVESEIAAKELIDKKLVELGVYLC